MIEWKSCALVRLMSAVPTSVALGCMSLATGCDEPLSRVDLIDKTRVLAARVEVFAEPERASPRPGERATVRFVVVAPEPEAAFAYRLSACVARESVSALVDCAEPPFAEAVSLDPLPEPPSIAFDTPAALSGREWLAVQGVVCPSGTALTGEGTATCSDGSHAQSVSVDFPLDDGSAPNTNPALASLSLDGSELSPDTALGADCSSLPAVAAGSTDHALGVELSAGARDPLPRADTSAAPRESLLVSYFVTAGEMESAYASVPSSAQTAAAASRWHAPNVRSELVARLFVVVRDGRGGSDFAERRVCVVP